MPVTLAANASPCAYDYAVGPVGELDDTLSCCLGPGMSAVWAPDSSRILFTRRSNDPALEGVWVMNRDGNGLFQIVARTDVVSDSARWSPDMTKISFMVGATTYSIKNADGSGC